MPTDAREFLEERIDKPATDSPSPVGRWLEGTLRELTDNSLTFEFTVREEMTNPFGVLHGGMAGAIADDVIGTAVFGLCDTESFASVDISLDFLSRVKEGDVIYATASIVRDGKRIIHVECDIEDEVGNKVVRATSNLIKDD